MCFNCMIVQTQLILLFLITGYLKEKACILITHQVHHLSEVDHIVLMDNVSISI